ncbi:MAG: hypothetical protein ACPGQU_06720 [Candidatus Puniceispirillaceae bacterium]|jgi:hypothetical protein
MLKIIALTLLAILAIFIIARLARRPAVARKLVGLFDNPIIRTILIQGLWRIIRLLIFRR